MCVRECVCVRVIRKDAILHTSTPIKQQIATHFNTLHYTATQWSAHLGAEKITDFHCNTMQHTTLQHSGQHLYALMRMTFSAAHCDTLHFTATHWSAPLGAEENADFHAGG